MAINTDNWHLKNPKKARELAERFDEPMRSGAVWKSGSGEEYSDMVHGEDWHNRVMEKARNDYDLRRTLEASAMSGKNKAQKILDGGFNNLGDVANATNFTEKAFARRGGKNFSSPADYMGLTQSMVERDRRKQGELYDSTYATKDELDEALEKVKSGGMKDLEEKEPEKSEQTIKDEAAVKDWEDNWSTGGIYNNIGPAKKTPGTVFLDWYMSENFQDDAALMPEIS